MSDGMTSLRRLRPQAVSALDRALDEAGRACPEGLLDLCQARVRTLTGGGAAVAASEDPRLRAVADYARSPLFDDTERLAIEFTEQYVLDVANMPDQLVADLHARLGTAAMYAFVMGLYAVDQAERLRLTAGVHPVGQA